ncbi:hypothetical protein [Mucilaginibacter terrae]|uniref:DUF748 domain-containing protein n=1 Tax=Mucilaginibacter terrae TaxID=1955052 RepID=A0ABU3GSQ9_9SPHI|nr:hypothetical protein [Mucilaginibacter terrae]MDT3402803.1 hypothetical protein [Mucilaginibacter terrae]
MAGSVFKTRTQKIVLAVLAALALLLLIVVLFINSFLKPVLTQKLKEGVVKATDSLYQVNFTDLDLNIFRGKASLYNIEFKPDTAVYKKLKRQGKAPFSLYNLQVKQVSINGAKAIKMFFKKELEVGNIVLTGSKVQLNKYGEKPGTGAKEKRTLYQKIAKDIKHIKVDAIQLDDMQFTFNDYSGKKAAASILRHISVRADDLLIDSATQADTTRTLFCKDITARLRNYTGQSTSGLYKYRVKSLELHTAASRVTASGVEVQPLPVSVYFAKSKTDRFACKFDSITLNNFDFNMYYRRSGITIADARLEGGFFEVFSNPNGSIPATDRLVTFPHWAIRHQFKTIFNIDTLRIKNTDVSYRQYNKQSKKSGAVKFLSTSARFLNITNSKQALQKNNICRAYVHTRFMGVGGLDLWFNFNLNDADYKYSYRGHLGAMDMRSANTALVPLSMIQITSGNLKSIDFKVSSTQKVSNGQLKILYNNLNVKLLRQDDEKGFTKKSLLSLLANSFVIKSDNPDKTGQSPRLATLAFIRPGNFPFFKTIWFTLLNGIKASGMGKAPKANERTAKKIRKEKEKAAKKARKLKEKEDKKFKEKLEKTKSN